MTTKIIIISCFFVILGFKTYAQYALSSEVSNGNMDNNMSLMLEKTKKRNSFAIGLKIHLKTPYLNDGQRYIFYRNSYAASFSDFVGAKIGYERRISPNKWKTLSFHTFGNSYYSRMRTKLIAYTGDSFYIFNRMNFLESNLGLGMKFKVVQPIYLTFKVGGGAALIWDIDKSILIHGGKSWTWQFSRLFSAGLTVKL